MLNRLWVAAAVLAFASPLAAQDYKDAHRLGGATAFVKPPLTDAASLKRMADNPAIGADVRTVFREAGMPDVADAFLAAISQASSAARTGSCSNAAPADGVVVECDAPVGATLEWMAYRPRVKGKRVPGRLERVRWAGKRSFAAFLFRVTVSNKLYTFIVPKLCGNFSLASVRDAVVASAATSSASPVPSPSPSASAPAAAAEAPAPAPRPAPSAAPSPSPSPSPAPPAASGANSGTNANGATGANTGAGANAEARAQASSPGGSGTASIEKRSPFFVDALLGGERRNRPAELAENKPTDFTQGSGFVGLKVGVARKFESNWEVAGAAGFGAMFLFKHDTINQWPLFVDAEVNRYFGRNGVFVGTGLSMWDLTRGDLWTPAGALRFGIPLGHHPRHPIYFLGEGRWYLDHRTHLETHREMWGGLRIHL